MARSRTYGRRRGKSYGKSRGYYKFTPKRKAALRKAQFVSAKNRKGKGLSNGKKLAIGVGVLAGVGAIGAVMGTRSSNLRVEKNAVAKAQYAEWKKTASPERKEGTVVGSGISNANPSRTTAGFQFVPSSNITESDRGKANSARQKQKDRDERPMRNIDSDKATERQVKGVLRAVGRPGGAARLTQENKLKTPLELVEDGLPNAVRGRRSSSYKGTPGGTRTPAKTTRPNTANGLTDAEHDAATGFDTELYTPAASYQRSRSVLGLRGDPMQALRGIQAEDEKLLNPPPAKKAAAKKAPAKKAPAKKAAPTTGTNRTADAKPPGSSTPKPQPYGNWQQAVDDYVKKQVDKYRVDNPYMSDDEIKRYYSLPPYGTL